MVSSLSEEELLSSAATSLSDGVSMKGRPRRESGVGNGERLAVVVGDDRVDVGGAGRLVVVKANVLSMIRHAGWKHIIIGGREEGGYWQIPVLRSVAHAVLTF